MSRPPGRRVITWTPPGVSCPDCGIASAAHLWAMEDDTARCPQCAAQVDLVDLTVTRW